MDLETYPVFILLIVQSRRSVLSFPSGKPAEVFLSCICDLDIYSDILLN